MDVAEQRKNHIREAKASLTRIRDFNPASLARQNELGTELNFLEVVPCAARLIDLFRQISVEVLDDLPPSWLDRIQSQANAEFNRFKQILDFSFDEGNPRSRRDTLISEVDAAYDRVFDQLAPSIAFSVRRSTDFGRLEQQARGAIQAVEDRSKELAENLQRRKSEADEILAEIRKTAAEQGVSQQAIYFRDEAERHETEAQKWLKRTVWSTIALGSYAVLTLILYKVPFLAPANAMEATQIAISKALIFATIASFTLLSAKNYTAHRHNTVVNKHRQNSLVTYKALVDAAGDQANRDIVLTKAAESIFGAQATGFAKGSEAAEGGVLSMVNLAPGMMKTTSGG